MREVLVPSCQRGCSTLPVAAGLGCRAGRGGRSLWVKSGALSLGVLLGGFLADAGLPLRAEEARASPQEAGFADHGAPADRALREEQLRVAKALVEQFPNNDDAVYLLGLVYEIQGDVDSAVACWERSLALDPSRADAHRSLGYVYELREELGPARQHFEQAVALDPKATDYRIRLAHARMLGGEPAAVLETLAAVSQPLPMVERLRGQACQQLDRLNEAREHYEAALRLDPDFAEACYGLAQVCARQGETEAAVAYRQRFAALKSESQIRGRRQRSEFDALRIAQASTAQTLTDVGRVYLALERPTEAERLWERAAVVDPDHVASRFHRLMLLQQAGRNAEAVVVCRELIRIEPDNGIHQLGLGNLLLRLGRTAEAEEAFRAVVRLAPERPEGYFALAQLLSRQRESLAEAEQLAQRSVELMPAAPHFFVLGRVQFLNGHFAEASASLDRACALEPGNAEFARWRAALRRPTAPAAPGP